MYRWDVIWGPRAVGVVWKPEEGQMCIALYLFLYAERVAPDCLNQLSQALSTLAALGGPLLWCRTSWCIPRLSSGEVCFENGLLWDPGCEISKQPDTISYGISNDYPITYANNEARCTQHFYPWLPRNADDKTQYHTDKQITHTICSTMFSISPLGLTTPANVSCTSTSTQSLSATLHGVQPGS